MIQTHIVHRGAVACAAMLLFGSVEAEVPTIGGLTVIETNAVGVKVSAMVNLPEDFVGSYDVAAVFAHGNFCYTNLVASDLVVGGRQTFDVGGMIPQTEYGIRLVASFGDSSAETDVTTFTTMPERFSLVPEDAEPIEYVESRGDAWINTGVSFGPSNYIGFRIVADMAICKRQDGQWATDGIGGHNRGCGCCLGCDNGGRFAASDGNLDWQTGVNYTDRTRLVYDLTFESASRVSYKVSYPESEGGGVVLDTSKVPSAPTQTGANLPWFGWRSYEKSDSTAPDVLHAEKNYGIWMWNGDQPACQLIPCKDPDGRACFFDAVSGLYVRSNGGDFIAGPKAEAKSSSIQANVARYDGETLFCSLESAAGLAKGEEIWMCSGFEYGGVVTSQWESVAQIGGEIGSEGTIVAVSVPKGARYIRFRCGETVWSNVIFLPETEIVSSPKAELANVRVVATNVASATVAVGLAYLGRGSAGCDLDVIYGHDGFCYTNQLLRGCATLGSHSFVISGLVPQTVYWLRFRADSGLPDGVTETEALEFTTESCVPSCVLPDEAVRVEYVESDGTAWIDTGATFGPSNCQGFRMKADMAICKRQDGQWSNDGIGGGSVNTCAMGCDGSGRFCYANGFTDVSTGIAFTNSTRLVYDMSFTTNAVRYQVTYPESDGGAVVVDVSTGVRAPTEECTDIAWFGWRYYNGSGAPNVLHAEKNYGIWIWNEDRPVVELLPCLASDGVACFYDTVSKTYVRSRGGAFTAGPLSPTEELGIEDYQFDGNTLFAVLSRKRGLSAYPTAVWACFDSDYRDGGTNDWANVVSADSAFAVGDEMVSVSVHVPVGSRYVRFFSKAAVSTALFVPELKVSVDPYVKLVNVRALSVEKTALDLSAYIPSIGSGAEFYDLDVVYGHDGFCYTNRLATHDSAVGERRFRLDGLAPNTEYAIRLVAQNDLAADASESATFVVKTLCEDVGPFVFPPDITQVEYVESDGTQWMDSQYVVGSSNYSTFRVIGDVAITQPASGNRWGLNGFGNGNGTFVITFGCDGNGRYAYGDGQYDVSTDIAFHDSRRQIYDLKFGAASAASASRYTVTDYESGKVYVDVSFTSKQPKVDGYTYPLFCWKRYDAANPDYIGSNTANGKASAQKIYGLKFYDGDVLAAQYVPAHDANGVPCLYEVVGKTRHYALPVGSAPLVAGPVKVRSASLSCDLYDGMADTVTFSREQSGTTEDVYVCFGATYGGNSTSEWENVVKVGAFDSDALCMTFPFDIAQLEGSTYVRTYSECSGWAKTDLTQEMSKCDDVGLHIAEVRDLSATVTEASMRIVLAGGGTPDGTCDVSAITAFTYRDGGAPVVYAETNRVLSARTAGTNDVVLTRLCPGTPYSLRLATSARQETPMDGVFGFVTKSDAQPATDGPTLSVVTSISRKGPIDLTVTREKTDSEAVLYVEYGREYGGANPAAWLHSISNGVFAAGEKTISVQTPFMGPSMRYVRLYTSDGEWSKTILVPATGHRPKTGFAIIIK